MELRDNRGRVLSNRQRKNIERRREIALAAGVSADASSNLKFLSITATAEAVDDDDFVRATKVYNALKAEIDGSKRRPFNADNKLASPPCRFNEDDLEPFLLRIARRLRGGSPRIEFGTLSEFASPSHKSWEAFITAMLLTDLRTLMANITRASRITG